MERTEPTTEPSPGALRAAIDLLGRAFPNYREADKIAEQFGLDEQQTFEHARDAWARAIDREMRAERDKLRSLVTRLRSMVRPDLALDASRLIESEPIDVCDTAEPLPQYETEEKHIHELRRAISAICLEVPEAVATDFGLLFETEVEKLILAARDVGRDKIAAALRGLLDSFTDPAPGKQPRALEVARAALREAGEE